MGKMENELAKHITMRTGKPCFYCSICGDYFYGYGNNPYPVVKDPDAQCCDECNRVVITKRLRDIAKEVTK